LWKVSNSRQAGGEKITGGKKSSLAVSKRKEALESFASHERRRVSQTRGEVLMAKLLAPYLLTWKEVEAMSDLECLVLVLDHLRHEGGMEKLEKQGKWGRDDYPIRPV
jgi:hypothetical protein